MIEGWHICCSNKVRLFIALAIVFVAFVLDVNGFSFPYWNCAEAGGVKTYAGLWKTCSEVAGVITCDVFVKIPTPAWFKAVQAMEILGMIFLFGALLVLTILVIWKKQQYVLRVVAICFLVFSALTMVIGQIIWGAESAPAVTDNISFAFVFVSVSAGLAVIASLFLCFGMDMGWEDDE